MEQKFAPGFYPFWFWNDRLDTEEIRRQIAEMAEQGIRGFFIHPRQGLGQPYLSESFLDLVEEAVEAAEEHGLWVHLYDEYPYPSGIAGGEVILGKPQYRATRLLQKTYTVCGGEVEIELPRGRPLSVVAHPICEEEINWAERIDLIDNVGLVLATDSYNETGLTTYNRKRYFASGPTPVLEAELPEGTYKIFASLQAVVEKFKYWDGYVDVMNGEAVREFIDLTHERYRRHLGKYFGSRVVSIFTDEIAPSWSDTLPARFQQEYGYDLLEHLPALEEKSHPEHMRVVRDLFDLKYRVFCETFEKPVADWCERSGLAYSGEKKSVRLSQLKHMDLPGGDPGHFKAGSRPDLLKPEIRQNARATASAAYFYGRKGALAECYHSLGWSGTLQDAKLIAEGLLLLGVDYLVPHGFFYSTHGLKKHDAPPSFFFQMPYWPLFGELSARMDALYKHLEGTHIEAKVAVYEPHGGLPTDEDLKIYTRTLGLLMEQHIDFHLVDTDILRDGEMNEGYVRLKDLEVDTVILPPMQDIEPELDDWLDAFREHGGEVIDIGVDDTWEHTAENIVGCIEPGLSVREGEAELPEVWTVRRTGNGRTLWFVLNTGDEAHEVVIDSGGELHEISILDQPVGLRKENGCYMREIRPFESFLLAEGGEGPSAVHTSKQKKVQIPISGPFDIEMKDKNLLRMNEWQLTVFDAEGERLDTGQVPAVPLDYQLETGRLRIRPGVRRFFGQPPQLSCPELKLSYGYSFQNTFEGRVELMLEPGSIDGRWMIAVNGSKFAPGDFGSFSGHIRKSRAVDVTEALRLGENVIHIEVEVDDLSQGLLNPIYLAGSFGVELDPIRLTAPVESGSFEEYTANRMPFYGGCVEYTGEIFIDRLPETGSVLMVPEFGSQFHAACEVALNQGTFRPLPWEPRQLSIPASDLNEGANEICIRVYTTRIRSFEGEWFDYREHTSRPVAGD